MGTVVNNTFGKCRFINPLPSIAERKAGSGWTRNTLLALFVGFEKHVCDV